MDSQGKESWAAELRVGIGKPFPLGVSKYAQGANFAVYTEETDEVALILYPPHQDKEGSRDLRRAELALDPKMNRTGQVWHIHIHPLLEGYEYMWRIGAEPHIRFGKNICLDPYAKIISSPLVDQFNDRSVEYSPRGVIPSKKSLLFDWEGVCPPRIPLKDLIIYELHVRGFTMNSDSEVQYKGTFLGIVEKIPYLKELGVNAVELLPVFEFNEKEWPLKDSNLGDSICQYWGYSTVGFFAPMNRYCVGNVLGAAVFEFRTMVRELHRAGIEVILDVVYNHTAEFGEGFYHFKGLAVGTYYLMNEDGNFLDYTGCGSTFNANHPIVAQFIHDSIRYWSLECGVDGFRFDLASAMTRDTRGNESKEPLLIHTLSMDPALRDVKLIAEPWDCGGLYHVGSFPHFGVWAEWNGRFRDIVRCFIKGDTGTLAEFATRICGSEDLYGAGRTPAHSINFVTAHDGFSLYDLVSYNEKHNEANGEDNRDGETHNNSWNCGQEGPTEDEDINQLRRRQVKNFLTVLLTSIGVPMLVMGDEYGHTKNGNNNTWCQDDEISWFNWTKCKEEKDSLLRFTRKLIKFRKDHAVFRRNSFMNKQVITWHGVEPYRPNWKSSYNFIAYTLHDDVAKENIYFALNAGAEERKIAVPNSHKWYRILDTTLFPPEDFPDEEVEVASDGIYALKSYGVLVLYSPYQDEEVNAENTVLENIPEEEEEEEENEIRRNLAALRVPGFAHDVDTESLEPLTEPYKLRESSSSINLKAEYFITRKSGPASFTG